MSICVLKWGAQYSVRRGRAKQIYLSITEREQFREKDISQLTKLRVSESNTKLV